MSPKLRLLRVVNRLEGLEIALRKDGVPGPSGHARGEVLAALHELKSIMGELE